MSQQNSGSLPSANPPKYQYGVLNPIDLGMGYDEISSGNYGDDEAMFDYVRHSIIKTYQPDAFKGMAKFKAIVLTAPGLESGNNPAIPSTQPSLRDKTKTTGSNSPPSLTEQVLSANLVPPKPIPLFQFKARIPELHASIPDPCDAIPSIGGGSMPDPTAIPPAVVAAIMMHPTFIAKSYNGGVNGTAGTILPQPGVGDIVEVEFEKGPSGGRIMNGTYVRMVQKNMFNGIEQVCEVGLSNLFTGESVGDGGSIGNYPPPRTGRYVFGGVNIPITNGDIPDNLLGQTAKEKITILQEGIAGWDRLVVAYNKKFPNRNFPGAGTKGGGMRSYKTQVWAKDNKPNLAATPGTSNHGWGMAIDISTSDSFGISGDAAFDTEEYKWLLANAPTYGWHHPSWAKRTGSKPEPWHWELTNQSSYIKKDPK
jgi:hypothetical protein